jgi:hypothetical protein
MVVRPRVFVSSVVKDFEEYREAARQGIEDAGGEPVLVNEDFPAMPDSSRNACLDGVDSSDIYIVIVGERGGWKTPSGKLVVEEEYEQARKRKKTILAFIQNAKRDEDAERLVNNLSDYIDGLFRLMFNSAAELRNQVSGALSPIVVRFNNRPVEVAMLQEKLRERYAIPNETRLRFVLSPERDEEVIDVITLDSPSLKQDLFEMGHANNVSLFSYEHSKSSEVQVDSLVIHQRDSSGRRNENKVVRLEISSGGSITIDMNVTGRINRGSLHGMGEAYVIVESDVIECLQSSFAFANAFYNKFDPYKRHQRFFYNSALSEIDYKKLVAEYKEKSSITFSHQEKEVMPAFDKSRTIGREDLTMPDTEINGTMIMFRRRLNKQ